MSRITAGVLLLVNRLRTVGGGSAGAGDRQHPSFPCLDGPERASDGPLRGCTVGRDLHRRATGFFGVVPVAHAASSLTAGESNLNMAQELTVVVMGSTGKQVGAVAWGPLERGHRVRAVTRAPNSSQAAQRFDWHPNRFTATRPAHRRAQRPRRSIPLLIGKVRISRREVAITCATAK